MDHTNINEQCEKISKSKINEACNKNESYKNYTCGGHEWIEIGGN